MKVFFSVLSLLSPLLMVPVVLNSKKPIWGRKWLDVAFGRSIDTSNLDTTKTVTEKEDCHRVGCINDSVLQEVIKKLEETRQKQQEKENK